MFSTLLFSGCAAVPSLLKPELQDEGEIFVYLEPLSKETANLKFTIDHCSVSSSDGTEMPLSLALKDIDAEALRTQRFFGSTRVPPGQYSGLLCTLKAASLATPEKEATLLVPEEPVEIRLPFEVRLKTAVVLSMGFQYEGSVQKEFGFTPRFSLSVPSTPPTGLIGYVVNRDDNTIAVIDKKSGHVASVIATGKGPESVAFNENARTVYISLGREDAIDVMDMAEGIVSHRINLNIGDGPRELLLTRDVRQLLVLNAASRTLSFVDPVSLAEVGRVEVGEGPRRLLLGRTGNRCYVFNTLSNTISVVDIANQATVATLSTEAGPLMGQFNRKGDRLYVIHEGSPYLSIIDPSSLSIVKRVYIGPGLSFIKVDTMTDILYAYRTGDARIEVYDPLSLTPGDFLSAMSGIVQMTIDSEENNLILLSGEMKKLISVNLISKKIVSETDMGENPVWVTLMGER